MMLCPIVFPFFLKYLTNAECTIGRLPDMSKSTLMTPLVLSAYGVNLDTRMLNKILCVVDKSDVS